MTKKIFTQLFYIVVGYITISIIHKAFFIKTLNFNAILEWFFRGYMFALGAITATFALILVQKLIFGHQK